MSHKTTISLAIAAALTVLAGSAAFAQSVNPNYGTGESRSFTSQANNGQGAFAQGPAASTATPSGKHVRSKRVRH